MVLALLPPSLTSLCVVCLAHCCHFFQTFPVLWWGWGVFQLAVLLGQSRYCPRIEGRSEALLYQVMLGVGGADMNALMGMVSMKG